MTLSTSQTENPTESIEKTRTSSLEIGNSETIGENVLPISSASILPNHATLEYDGNAFYITANQGGVNVDGCLLTSGNQMRFLFKEPLIINGYFLTDRDKSMIKARLMGLFAQERDIATFNDPGDTDDATQIPSTRNGINRLVQDI